MLATYVIAAIGLVFYVSRFPEKFCKEGRADIIGASHQVRVDQ